MPTIEQLTAYAQVLLQKGLNLQKEQTLVINAPVEGHDFVTLLSKACATNTKTSRLLSPCRTGAATSAFITIIKKRPS